MAHRTRNICGASASMATDSHYRYTVPVLDVVQEGKGNGKKTRLVNIDAVADALKVLPQHLLQFMSAELGTLKVSNSEIRGHWDAAELDSAVRKFEGVYLVCQADDCQKPELDVRASDDGVLKAKCRACGWRGGLDKDLQSEKVTKSILQHLSKAQHKWCGSLRGDPAWKVPDVLGLSAKEPGKIKVKKSKKEEEDKKEKTLNTEKHVKGKSSNDSGVGAELANREFQAGRNPGLSCAAADEADFRLPPGVTEDELKARHEEELSELSVKVDAYIADAKASAGMGKKGKERVDAAEREAERWTYELWEQQQVEMDELRARVSTGTT